MARFRIGVVCCVAGLMVASATVPAGASAAPPMVEKINKVRAKHGLSPLRNSPYLRRSSRRWGNYLMNTGQFGHIGIRASRRFPLVGEVLAYHRGWRPQRSGTVRRWLRSRGHRAALLSSSFRHVGTAFRRGRIGGRRVTIWVVQFGRR